jgi:anti-sigma regulatory factor (Ser/Thr protein kinase)
MAQNRVRAVIEELFTSREHVSSGEVAVAAGVTRQAAHHHLRAMVDAGQLARVGAGRGARYTMRSRLSRQCDLAGLEEDRVWKADIESLLHLDAHIFDNPHLKPVLSYAFTEMLNNAIDHSQGKQARIRWFLDSEHIAFEIEDDGIGVFRKVREARNLRDDIQAVGELAKGKQTTAPDQHTGQGIFFTSKLMDKFILASGQTAWTVDSLIEDEAIAWLDKARIGTLVRCEIDLATAREFGEVSSEFSDPDTFDFIQSRFRVNLFREGSTFVSRSEAKRVGARLEEFRFVELDFDGVEQVGQGFLDELFRVWSNGHPQTELIPINANPAISAMIAAVRSREPTPPLSKSPQGTAAAARSSTQQRFHR